MINDEYAMRNFFKGIFNKELVKLLGVIIFRLHLFFVKRGTMYPIFIHLRGVVSGVPLASQAGRLHTLMKRH